MPGRDEPIQLNLTTEQQRQIQQATGKLTDTLEFSIKELEERIAPLAPLEFKKRP